MTYNTLFQPTAAARAPAPPQALWFVPQCEGLA